MTCEVQACKKKQDSGSRALEVSRSVTVRPEAPAGSILIPTNSLNAAINPVLMGSCIIIESEKDKVQLIFSFSCAY